MKAGQQIAVALALAALVVVAVFAPVAAQSYATVTAQPGDTLSKIAARYCTTWQDIYSLNKVTIGPDPRELEVGWVLTVPDNCGGGSSGGGSARDSGARVHATGVYRPPFYDVAWGDTLYSVALRFGASVQALQAANGLTDDLIGPGWVLEIPAGGSNVVAPQPLVAGGGLERIAFNPGASAASRSGQIVAAQPAQYILGARAGQVIEVWTNSHGEPLVVDVRSTDGQTVGLDGVNSDLSNYLYGVLPATSDYLITVAPAAAPEGPVLNFDITVGVQ